MMLQSSREDASDLDDLAHSCLQPQAALQQYRCCTVAGQYRKLSCKPRLLKMTHSHE